MKTLQELSEQEHGAVTEFRQKVAEAFPGTSARYTLFGSRARGDAEAESDLDLLLELEIDRLSFADKETLHWLASEVSMQYGLILSVLMVDRATARARGDFSIFVTIKEEGIPL